MPHRELRVDGLLRLLPDVADLVPLREAVLSASTPDPGIEWAGSSAYATYDKRVLRADRIREVAQSAADAVQRRMERLHGAFDRLLESAARQDVAGVVSQLLALGEAAEAEERWDDAAAFYEVAARLGAALADAKPAILALRRLARAHWFLGDTEEAYTLYRRCFERAEAAGDHREQVVATLGLGNMRMFQGRWADAQAHYEAALPLCGESGSRLRGQLYANLSTCAREQGLLDRARESLDAVQPIWDELTTADQSVWWNNQGLLFMALGRSDEAEAAFHRALELAPDHFDRAMVLDNLAELAARRGLLSEAEAAARRAEEHALAVGSPRVLAEVYTRLGRICRLRGDPNGVTFFEKALELCRQRHYPLIEGHAHLEYGLFRRVVGDEDEARAYLERACEIFDALGAVTDQERARRELEVSPPEQRAISGA